jgi:hypothetical protein
MDRLATPRTLIALGAAVHLLALTLALVIGFAQDSPMPVLARVVDRAGPAISFGLLPPALAAVAWRRRDRALLGVAAVLLVPASMGTLGASLLALIAWVAALVRMPHRAGFARPAPAAVAAGVVALLALAAMFAPLTYANPACWTYTEEPDGRITYEPAPELIQQPGGFRAPSLIRSEERSAGVVEIDPDTGEPLDDPAPSGHVCVSDRTTLPQAGITALLALASVGGAAALGAHRPETVSVAL